MHPHSAPSPACHDPVAPQSEGRTKNSANALGRGPCHSCALCPGVPGLVLSAALGTSTPVSEKTSVQALRLMHAQFGSPAFNCSIARCSAPTAETLPESLLAQRLKRCSSSTSLLAHRPSAARSRAA